MIQVYQKSSFPRTRESSCDLFRKIPACAGMTALVVFLMFSAAPARAAEVFDRVMESGKIRCGYVISQALKKDPNTGEMSGIMADVVTEMGRLLDFEIEWAAELGWAETVDAMTANKIDAVCTNFWVEPFGAHYVGYTMPVYYSAVTAYIRAEDHRFDESLDPVNDPAVRVVSSDGEMASLIAGQDYPKATIVYLPQMGTDSSIQLMEIAHRKGDITFIDTALGKAFEATNPGLVRNITPENPVRVFANTIALPLGDVKLKSMLDAALLQMHLSGFVDKTLDKHETYPGSYYRAARPWEARR